MQKWAQKQTGFTIVELLIVIVVIAILAAITIVAYNGIQDRAKESGSQGASSQASKKMAAYAVDNSDQYPEDEEGFLTYAQLNEATGSGAGVTQGSTYQYSVGAGRRTYCLTTTTNGISYYTTEAGQTPTKGACDGHGSNGVPPIINYAANPSFEANHVNNSCALGQGGAGSCSRVAVSGQSGGALLRQTWTTLPTSAATGGLWTGVNSSSIPAAAGKTYTASGYIRNSWAGASVQLNLVGYTAGFGGVTGEVYGTGTTLAANIWTRVSVTWVAPPGTQIFTLRIRQGGGTLPPNTTATMDVDAFSLYESSTNYPFADGTTSGWAWLGTAHNSSSTGPPL
jgi:prepilin-type N-terminal cleavage/methylation domain-containing protein